MRKELEQKLTERWPTWFDVNGGVSHTLMPYGFQCENGWFGLIWRLCEALEPLVAEFEKQPFEPFEVLEVKQKLGGLRFYVNHRTDEIMKRIEVAEQESLQTCEVCGQPGQQLREGAWVKTLCDRCATEEAC